MCGIAGIMGLDGRRPDRAAVEAMIAALAHRGPDGTGFHADGDTALGHARLSIIDLHGGAQPIFDQAGRAVVANGEIYNYLELRRELSGYPFVTRSDSETALALYGRHGLDFADHLRGMYALAVHDPKSGRLVLARDPFGIKPLYYAETALGFVFASEIQALVAAGLVAAKARAQGVGQLLQLQFTTGRETAFDGVSRLLPGETVVIKGGRIVERRTRPALPQGGPEDLDEGAALERLKTALSDSVEVHQRADVPYGMFLSGGIDSSVVLALMARLNPTPVTAFTVGFPDAPVPDERAHAAKVAAVLGARHHEIPFSEADFWRLLPKAAAAMDDPAADYAVLPTLRLAEATAEIGLKVVLSGEGGDELFGGYGRYRSAMRPRLLGGRAMRRHGIFDRLGVLRDEPKGWRDDVAKAERDCAGGGRSRLQAAQAVDCADWLPNDLLLKLDRCLMAHGVEGRTPFLDQRVAEAAFRLPDRLKVRGGLGKWLLRRWLDRALPEAGAFDKKRGFTVPVGHWIGARASRLGPLLAADEAVAGLCRPGTVPPLLAAAAGSGKTAARAGFAAWSLLFFALWHRRHIRGMETDGDVFDALS